jgi:hypothetical protein
MPPELRTGPGGIGAGPGDQRSAVETDGIAARPESSRLVYGSRSVSHRRRSTQAELAEIDAAIIDAVRADHPVTLRGVYYRVMSAGVVPKTEQAYKQIGRRLLALRRAELVRYSHITDGTRWVFRPTTWSRLDRMLADAAASYRRALWDNQGVEVHIFVEKDAIVGVVDPITDEWDVPLGVLRGYCSESFAARMGEAIAQADCPVIVYNLGDHDPSGVDIWRDFRTKVERFAPDADVTFERLAVTVEQIGELNLPTRPTKQTDTRSRGFAGDSVEVDAIPAPRLREIVKAAIESHIDPEALALTRRVEYSERADLARIVGEYL